MARSRCLACSARARRPGRRAPRPALERFDLRKRESTTLARRGELVRGQRRRLAAGRRRPQRGARGRSDREGRQRLVRRRGQRGPDPGPAPGRPGRAVAARVRGVRPAAAPGLLDADHVRRRLGADAVGVPLPARTGCGPRPSSPTCCGRSAGELGTSHAYVYVVGHVLGPVGVRRRPAGATRRGRDPGAGRRWLVERVPCPASPPTRGPARRSPRPASPSASGDEILASTATRWTQVPRPVSPPCRHARQAGRADDPPADPSLVPRAPPSSDADESGTRPATPARDGRGAGAGARPAPAPGGGGGSDAGGRRSRRMPGSLTRPRLRQLLVAGAARSATGRSLDAASTPAPAWTSPAGRRRGGSAAGIAASARPGRRHRPSAAGTLPAAVTDRWGWQLGGRGRSSGERLRRTRPAGRRRHRPPTAIPADRRRRRGSRSTRATAIPAETPALESPETRRVVIVPLSDDRRLPLPGLGARPPRAGPHPVRRPGRLPARARTVMGEGWAHLHRDLRAEMGRDALDRRRAAATGAATPRRLIVEKLRPPDRRLEDPRVTCVSLPATRRRRGAGRWSRSPTNSPAPTATS